MPLLPVVKEASHVLLNLLNAPVWRRLFKRLSASGLFLSRLLFRIVHLFWAKLNRRQSRKETSSPKPHREDATSPGECPRTYTAIPDGQILPLDSIMASSYPFAGGSIRRNSSCPSLVDHLRADSPALPSASHSAASSVYDLPTQIPMDQIDMQDVPPLGRNPLRQDSEVSAINVEYDNETPEHYSPSGSAIQECPTWQELDQSSTLDIGRDHPGVPPSSAASTRSGRSPSRPSSRASGKSAILPDGWDLCPIFPDEGRRYTHRTKIVRKEVDLTLEAVDFDYESFEIPDGWERHVHPEGCRYFYNKSKRILTDVEICDPMQLMLVQERIQMIDELKDQSFQQRFPKDADIVLNIYTDDDGTRTVHYYCINHTERAVFFFKSFHANWLAMWGDVKGAFSKNHFRYELESQYWYSVQMYPHRMELKKALIDELRDIVLHLIGDTMTSVYSTSAYTLEDLHKILFVLSNVKDSIESDHTAGVMCLLARFMFIFYHNRFLNFHGESYARIERNFSVYGHALHPRSLFLRGLSLLLFFAPDDHLKNLQKMWVDSMLHRITWEQSFLTDWQELVTASSILLNANVAFLAIQSVDQSPPSWAQILSYASVVTNVGSMILGLLLIRQHRNKTSEHVLLKKHGSTQVGLEALAVMFSLPHALLMWGMILFLCAFTFMCTQSTRADSRFVVGISLAFCGLSILSCIWLNWQSNEPDTSEQNRTPAYGCPADGNDTASIVPSQAQDGRTSTTLPGGNGLSHSVNAPKGTTSVHTLEHVAHSPNVLIDMV